VAQSQPTEVSRYQAPVVAQSQYPQTAAPYVPATAVYSQSAAQYSPATPAATQYPAAGYPTYPAMAQNEAAPAPAEEAMPTPVPPQPENNGATTNGTNGHVNGYATTNGANGYPNGDCGCANGYTGGSYYYGNTGCDEGHGIGDYFNNPCYDSQWFGGVYFLYMERDRPTPEKLTAQVDHDAATDPYYPLAHTTALVQSDHDFREGVEIRLGSTFSVMDSCDTGCYGAGNSCAPCAANVYAWEVAWWGIDDDPNDVTYEDDLTTPRVRIYGMKNFAGLEYDRDGDGTYDNNVNVYYGYQLPIPDPGAPPYPDGYVAVQAQRVRSNFDAQSLELNIIKFPVCNMVCGSGYSGCNSGCYGDAGYGASGCEEECCPSLFTMYGSCGVRYFRVDDDFMYATEFASWSGGVSDQPTGFDGWSYDDDNELFYDIQVENHLVGPQVGWTMNYAYGCKWNFFANSTFGVFNNYIEHDQRMWSGGGGTVRFNQDQSTFNVSSDKDDISFLGELRLGGSYDISCNWRAVAAYRAVAIAGIATSTEQIPSDFTNSEWIAIIDSDSSVIVHGVQVGAECRY
jgi:hypothetical protein